MSLLLSKEACLDPFPQVYLWYRMSFKGSYSIRPNSSPSDNIAAQIPTADNQRHLWIFIFFVLGVELCLFLPGLSHIFVGHAPLSPAAVWVSVSSAHVFWARARRDAGQSLPLWFSVMHSLTRHSRRISLHPHILAFFLFFSFFFPSSSFSPLLASLFFLLPQLTSTSSGATTGLSNLSVCLTALGKSCLKCTYRSSCVLIMHGDWREHAKIHHFGVWKLPITTRSL